MFNQIYYGARHRFLLRIVTLGIVLAGNITFILLAATTNNIMDWQAILGIVFASFAFIGVVGVSVYATSSTFKRLFKEPQGYLTALTPTPAWKIILGNLIPSVIFDIISFVVGLSGIIVLSVGAAHGFTGEDTVNITTHWNNIVFAIAAALALYSLVIVAYVLYNAIIKTVFRRIPLRKLLAAIVTIAIVNILSWVNIVMLPFGELHRHGPFFAIEIIQPAIWHLAAMVLLILAQAAIIFCAAAYLLNRRS